MTVKSFKFNKKLVFFVLIFVIYEEKRRELLVHIDVFERDKLVKTFFRHCQFLEIEILDGIC